MHLEELGNKMSTFLFLLLIFAFCIGGTAQKLSPEEIIAKHVASIGKADMIADSKRVMAIGGCEFVTHRPEQKIPGRAMLASDGTDLAFFTKFGSIDYPMERIGLFDEKVNIPPIKMGNRSPLGGFLNAYNKTLEGHIFGGIVFSTWRFLSPGRTDGKFEVEGKKKLGDREAWVVNFTPKGGLTGGSYVKLYFDAENFHHLRTVYRQKQPENGFANTTSAGRGSSSGDWDADMANNGFTLTEDFSDFRSDKGLVLPHKYSIALLSDGTNGTTETDWNFTIEEYRLIKDFPADFFTFKSQT